jgi:hypothetical protein
VASHLAHDQEVSCAGAGISGHGRESHAYSACNTDFEEKEALVTNEEQTGEISGPVLGYTALAFVVGGVAVVEVVASHYSSVEGWTALCLALHFAHSAVTYNRSDDVVFRVSRRRRVFILGICTLPPLVLLLLFGDRPGWAQPLVILFVLSLMLGPVLLLWRFRVPRE